MDNNFNNPYAFRPNEGQAPNTNPYQANASQPNTNPYQANANQPNANPYQSDMNQPNGSYAANSSDLYGVSGNYATAGTYHASNPYTQYSTNNGVPVDVNGNPIKDRFGLKMAFSIIEIILFNRIFGILALTANITAHRAYITGDIDTFKSKRKLSTVMLCVGTGLGILGWILCIVIGVMGALSDSNSNSGTGTRGNSVSVNVDWEEYGQFTLEGHHMSVPMSVDEFFDNGYYIYEEDEVDMENYIINAGEYLFLGYCNSDDVWTGYICLENMTDSALPAGECTITGIDIYDDEPYSGVTTPIYLIGGLDFHSSYSDICAALGTPDETEEDEDDSSYMSYVWLPDENNYTDNYIEFSFEDDSLYMVSIYYNGDEF